jgi:hypothetical protein
MTAKSSPTADAVRASVIRRPAGAAATARAASTFQGEDAARSSTPAPVVHEVMRTTMHLPPAMRTGLKRRALDGDTTMSGLIRAAIAVGLQDPATLAGASLQHRRAGGGARTTLDVPRDVHRTLKRLAADEDTSVQALVLAAILRVYPDLR